MICRNGRTQHSCDGNPINQVSLCSTLGLQHDLAEEANFPTFVDRHRGDYRGQSGRFFIGRSLGLICAFIKTEVLNLVDAFKLATELRFLKQTQTWFNGTKIPINYKFNQFQLTNNVYSSTILDPKLVRTPYESSAISSNRYYPSRSLGGGSSHESSFGSSHRYGATPLTSGLRCFNGGELGRICCCTTDFCNFSVNHFCTKTVAAAMLFLLWRYFQRLF